MVNVKRHEQNSAAVEFNHASGKAILIVNMENLDPDPNKLLTREQKRAAIFRAKQLSVALVDYMEANGV